MSSRAHSAGSATVHARAWPTLVLVVLAACAALVAGAWGVTRDRGGSHADHDSAAVAAAASPATPDASWLPLDGGFIRLDSVSEKATPHHAKHIALADTDQVPEDVRRLFVGVTVAAVDGPVSLDPTRFAASGPGLLELAPKLADFEAVTVEPGAQLSGYVVFDVPREEQLVEVAVPGLTSRLVVVEDGVLADGAAPTAPSAPAAPAEPAADHAHG